MRWKRWMFGLPLSFLVPFLLLVRLSTYLYVERSLNGWLAIAASSAAAALLLSIVVAVIARKLGAAPGLWMLKATGVVVVAYAVYLLVFISAANVKSPELQRTYRELHPVLRLSLSTFVLIDAGAVVTDTARRPADYAAMGLPTRNTSAHYRQSDGYVHAVDLRTRGRTGVRNYLTRLYFDAMGFNTLRHTGTADHLHISLPVR